MGTVNKAMLLSVVVLLNSAAAQTVLPLKTGTYVSTDTACTDAPLAATQTVNRLGIQYPHLWGCKAKVTEHKGNSYRLDQTCNGGEHDKVMVKVLGPARYAVGDGASPTQFRFCSATTD